MRNKLLKIARYLGQNGLYKEAANLKKLAEAATQAQSDMDVLEQSDREDRDLGRGKREFFHGQGPKDKNSFGEVVSSAHPYTQPEVANPYGPHSGGPFGKIPAAWPQELQGVMWAMPSGRISGAFFRWCHEKGLKPTEQSLAKFLNTDHPVVDLPGIGEKGGRIRKELWKQIKDLVREHPDFEGEEMDPRVEAAIREAGPDGGFNWAMDDDN